MKFLYTFMMFDANYISTGGVNNNKDNTWEELQLLFLW